MARRSVQSGELLVLVLAALRGGQPTSEGDLVGDLEERLGQDHLPRPSRVLVALAALESEGLVEAVTLDGASAYRIAPSGIEALDARADAAVLRLVGRAGSSGEPEGGPGRAKLEQVTILFTDLVGSTELLERLGEDAAHEHRRRHFARLRRAVREHGGAEVKSLGDGLMVAFDSAPAAARSAVAMQRAVATSEDAVELRVGIASGETMREDDDYFGRPVIVASRLCDAASGGDVLISEATRALISEPVAPRLEPLGPLVLKGLSQPVAASAMRVRPLTLSA